MARKREGMIHESTDHLHTLLRSHTGHADEARIRMLLSLQQDASRTFDEVARLIEHSERTVRRWWKLYRKGGLPTLLSEPSALQIKSRGSSLSPYQRPQGEQIMGEAVLCFLNELPVADNPAEWGNQMNAALTKLFPDVDRVTTCVNVDCDLDNPDDYQSRMCVLQQAAGKKSKGRDAITTSQLIERQPGDAILEAYRHEKYPLHLYQPPYYLDYYFKEKAYVGTIFLWREQARPMISTTTLDTLKRLERFVVFALTDCIARNQRREPDLRVFMDVVSSVANKYRLSRREQEVLLHMLLGREQKETAQLMKISYETVHKHTQAIYRKTGTQCSNELYARHFTPLRGT